MKVSPGSQSLTVLFPSPVIFAADRNFLILFLFFFIPFTGIAQSKEVLLSNAERAWIQNEFAEAAEYYSEAWALDTSDLYVAFRLAESFRLDNRYCEAADIYEFITKSEGAYKLYPAAWFYHSIMIKQQGNYPLFCELLRRYLEMGNDQDLLMRAQNERRICDNPELLSMDSLPVNIIHLNRNVNTPFSEFGAFQLYDSLLIFSALRPTSGSDFQSFARFDYRTAIFSSEIRVSGYQQGEEVSARINRRNTHNANLSYDTLNNRAFFSRCTDAGRGNMECNIMVAEYTDKGRWRRPVKVAGKINLEGYTNTQPHYTTLNGKGVLYFVSNRPGGFGGMDIWYSIEFDNGFAEPVNCGSMINTPGNEVTPFYDVNRGVMFFSSDWHPGYGGYDVFWSKGGLAAWEKVNNAGLPVNSPANDHHFSVNPNDSNGYFTSNRPGSFHIRGETCCNDIYMYEWKPLPEPLEPDLPLAENKDSIQEMARKLLPLMLFFSNDEPDPATMRTTSTKDYRKALDEYVAMKDTYKREYSKGLSGSDAEKAREDIEEFFGIYVQGGYEKLEMLTDYLIEDLSAGNSVQLMISGYCSPLSTTEYNINLARRRIHSLILYLEKAKGGALKPYIERGTEDGVRLIIYEDPVGKEKASPFVSDNPHDLRNSVYSRAAAFERRIEIAMYLSHKPDEMVLISEMPRLTLEKDTLDLKNIMQGERIVVAIPYRNDGKSELMIRHVDFDADKLWVEWSNEPLLPGAEQRLMVLVNTGELKGNFSEEIIITTNLPDKASVTIIGNVGE